MGPYIGKSRFLAIYSPHGLREGVEFGHGNSWNSFYFISRKVVFHALGAGSGNQRGVGKQAIVS